MAITNLPDVTVTVKDGALSLGFKASRDYAIVSGLREAIDALGYDTVHCPTLDDCLRVAPQSSPAAVLVELPDDSENAVSLLQLLRRTLPSTPLVIVAPNASLETRARIHPLRPYYFAVPPVPSDELRAVIQGAVTSQPHRA